MIGAAVSRYVAAAPRATEANLKTYFDEQGIDGPRIVEVVLRQVEAECDAFFVSSIVRGLGGPTSDIDVMLEHSGKQAAPGMSTMMFVEDRRIGLKHVATSDVATAIAEIDALIGKPQVTAAVSGWDKTHEIGWVDLERLINGWSYRTGMAYIHALPAYCTVACRYFAQDALYFARLAVLADAAGACRASLAYGRGATLAMMDQVMAACGRVQVTRKWTLERWRRFREEAVPEAAECIAPVVAACAVLGYDPGAGHASGSQILEHVEHVLGLLGPELCPSAAAFQTNYAEQNRSYFGSARVTHDARQIVVADAKLFELAARPWCELAAVDAATARSLVTIAQAGLLSPGPQLAS